ncbi:MAG: hypothetical protein ACI82S_001704 [Patiriisocius sp.]|jgi:hypothetical protein
MQTLFDLYMAWATNLNGHNCTVELPNSDEQTDELTTYAKFWTQLALPHSTNARLRNPL